MKLIRSLYLLGATAIAGLPAAQAATLAVPGTYPTIQAAVTAAVNGDVVQVAPGTYNERVLITKNITLESTGGRAVTTIDGSAAGPGGLGTIQLDGTLNGVTIGGTGKGFTIIGFDGPTAGIEVGAIYGRFSLSNIQIIDNEITANGDAGLLFEFAASGSNILIDGNEFSGQTFVGPNPAGSGFALQDTLVNVPRQLVTLGNGGDNAASALTNVTFTNNLISGIAGGLNTDIPPVEQGNTLVTIDTSGSNISNNTFSGTTTRFGSALRVRRPNTVIEDNSFDNSNMGASTVPIFIQNSSTPGAEVALNNQYVGEVAVFFAGGNVVATATIQGAINAAPPATTIYVYSGTHNEQLVISKALVLTAFDPLNKPIIDFTGSVSGWPTLIAVTAPNVTVENFKLNVDFRKLSSAVIASRLAPALNIGGLQVLNNEITTYASSAGGSFGTYGDRNAISVNYTGSTNYRTGGGNVTISGNVISGRLDTDPLANGAARFFRSGVSMDECSGTFEDNTIQTINHDILARFTSSGTIQIEDNQFNGGGVQIAESNAGPVALNVVNNTFNGAVAAPNTAVLRLQNNQQNIPTTISGNTFTGHKWGVSLENYKNVTVSGNQFTPGDFANYRHITINTKTLVSTAPVDMPQTTIAAAISSNTFNAPPTASGAAIIFYNHHSVGSSLGSFTLSGNTFNAGIATFLRFDDSVGGTFPAPGSFPEYNLGAASNTVMAPWTAGIDVSNNNFDVGTGAKLPSAMTNSELFDLENLFSHGIDVSGLGLLRVKATELYVTSNGTIQRAINAATVGDVVNVGPGTYVEDVAFNKAITLKGATGAVISGPIGGVDGATVRFSSGGSNGVIEGFEITRAGNNTTDWNNGNLNFAGIAIQGQSVSNVTIRNNLITGNRSGIDINNSSGHTIARNSITNNHTGVIFRNQTDNLVVEQNVITHNRTVGVIFLDGSGGTNVPVQSASDCLFTNNNISENWYGQIVDRQIGGSLPAAGSNIKNFSGNWFGSVNPVSSTANSAEPGYASLIPLVFGGTATAPGGQPDICGPASANFDITPLLLSDADTDFSAPGFQGDFSSIKIVTNGAQAGSPTYSRIQEAIELDSDGGLIAVPSGTYPGSVDATSNALTLAGGESPGLVVVDGDFTLDSDDTLEVDIDGVTTAGVDYDQWQVTGNVTLGGASLSVTGDLTGVNSSFDVVVINKTNGGAISGTFDSLPNGTVFPAFLGASVEAAALYTGGTGNDFTLTTLPEIAVTPDPLSFGTTSLAWLNITVDNTGDGPLTLSLPSISGLNAPDFEVTSFPASAIAAGDSATITVKFQPLAPDGSGRTASLAFNTNDFDEPSVSVALSGTSPAAVAGLTLTEPGNVTRLEGSASSSHLMTWVVAHTPTPSASYQLTMRLTDENGNAAPAGAIINVRDGSAPAGSVTGGGDNQDYLQVTCTSLTQVNLNLSNVRIVLPANYYNNPNPRGFKGLRIQVSVDPVVDNDPTNDPLLSQRTITVDNVNQSPTITLAASPTFAFLEDDGPGPITVAGVITNVSPGGGAYPDPEAPVVTLSNNGNPFPTGLFDSPPTAVLSSAPGVFPATYNVVFDLALDANTASSFQLRATVNDGIAAPVNGSATRTFTVTAVNDAPILPAIANPPPVAETAGATTINIPGFIDTAAINRGGTLGNEQSQTLTFTCFVDSNADFGEITLFNATGLPAISPTGTLTYTPRADAFGTATVRVRMTDSGGTANGGANLASPDQTFVITITNVNDTPSYTFVSPRTQTVNEDSGPHTVPGFIPIVTQNPGGTSGTTGSYPAPTSGTRQFNFIEGTDFVPDTLLQPRFTVTTNNNALFSALPKIDASGTLTYALAQDRNGTATVSVQINDYGTTGGTTAANGTADPKSSPLSGTYQFDIVVTARNDQPVFNIAGDTSGLDPEVGGATTVGLTNTEDEAPLAKTVAGFAVNWKAAARVDTSASDESGQVASSYLVSVLSGGSLFSTAPAINAAGTLTYTVAANQAGTATIQVIARDNGSGSTDGSPNPTVVTQDDRGSAPQTFTITVNPLNDPPAATFSNPAVVATEEDAPQTRTNWINTLTVGPGSEAVDFPTQGIASITYVSRTNPTLLDSIAINDLGGNKNDPANWELAFAPAPGRYGVTTVTINVTDDGSSVAPNNNSQNLTFVLHVLNVNDPPSFTWATSFLAASKTVTRAEDALPVSITTNFITNRTWGGLPGTEETGQGYSAPTSQAFEITTSNDALFSALPVVDGTRTGTTAGLTFTPAPNAYGTAVVTVTYKDNGFSGGTTSTTGTPDEKTFTDTFTIVITPVNDAPEFTLGANQAVLDDAGPQTVPNFLTGLRLGPVEPKTPVNEEEVQTIADFKVEVISNPGDIFDAVPAISLNYTPGGPSPGVGELTYTPKPGSQGTATIQVTVKDSGGTPGVDTTIKTFSIIIHPVPEVTTVSPPDNVTQARATLKGTVDSKGAYTGWVFEYGLLPDLSDAVQTAANVQNVIDPLAGPQDVSQLITNLKAGTTYYYRAVATNAFATRRGLLNEVPILNPPGTIKSFTTLPNQWTYDSGPAARNSLGAFTAQGLINPANQPGSRQGALSWGGSDGKLYVFGGLGYGQANVSSKLNDLWSFDPATGNWVWLKGSSAVDQPGVYPPTPDNLPGASYTPGARHTSPTWKVGNDFYLFGGFGIGVTRHNDLWRFDTASGNWAHVKGTSFANQLSVTTPGPLANPGSRQGSVAWTDADGTLWLFGGYGYGTTGTIGVLNDLWNFDPTSGNWTYVSGPTTVGDLGGPSQPRSRRDAHGWVDRSGKLWLFGGLVAFSGANYQNDLWVYDPGTGVWTQVDAGVLNGAGSATQPAARYAGLTLTTPEGALLLIGGGRDGGPFYNDIWQLDWAAYANTGSTAVWKPLTTANSAGAAVGTLGVGSPANKPGGRFAPAGFVESAERIWLFSGAGFAPSGLTGRTADLWRYELSPIPLKKWDSDADGLDDGWEIATFGNTTTTAGGATDTDGDGDPDAFEEVVGTNANFLLNPVGTDTLAANVVEDNGVKFVEYNPAVSFVKYTAISGIEPVIPTVFAAPAAPGSALDTTRELPVGVLSNFDAQDVIQRP